MHMTQIDITSSMQKPGRNLLVIDQNIINLPFPSPNRCYTVEREYQDNCNRLANLSKVTIKE